MYINNNYLNVGNVIYRRNRYPFRQYTVSDIDVGRGFVRCEDVIYQNGNKYTGEIIINFDDITYSIENKAGYFYFEENGDYNYISDCLILTPYKGRDSIILLFEIVEQSNFTNHPGKIYYGRRKDRDSWVEVESIDSMITEVFEYYCNDWLSSTSADMVKWFQEHSDLKIEK
jgi:hypothetical protein